MAATRRWAAGFIAGLDGGGNGTALVRAVTDLGQVLDLMTVGIETRQQ
ncbi:EAL domain-containing protein [Deinococcus marmoris]|nr:EAL domain-containing protein [Deinococcus marmoris]